MDYSRFSPYRRHLPASGPPGLPVAATCTQSYQDKPEVCTGSQFTASIALALVRSKTIPSLWLKPFFRQKQNLGGAPSVIFSSSLKDASQFLNLLMLLQSEAQTILARWSYWTEENQLVTGPCGFVFLDSFSERKGGQEGGEKEGQ